MPDEILPALTPEEWANLPSLRERLVTWAGHLGGDPAWMMAVYNATLPDGDPRKITKSDIAGLDASDKNEYAPELERLAKKLKALLPPSK